MFNYPSARPMQVFKMYNQRKFLLINDLKEWQTDVLSEKVTLLSSCSMKENAVESGNSQWYRKWCKSIYEWKTDDTIFLFMAT